MNAHNPTDPSPNSHPLTDPPRLRRQHLVVLDVEGVLTPEIWIAVAEATGVDALRRTTQDEPDYAKLMQGRIEALTANGIGLTQIQRVIGELEPLPGAGDFLDRLRAQVQVVLLSDTFEQFISPLMAKLGYPAILCHHLDVLDDRIVGFTPRIPDQKRRAVQAFKGLNYRVYAAGDSFNDLSMIDEADAGFLFHAPQRIREQRDDLSAFDAYDDLLAAFEAVIGADGTQNR